ncbi:kinase-like protein [Ramicandelaber brevisporus]|nr:kinase-like protein [Ramicandelaber brevisporus]
MEYCVSDLFEYVQRRPLSPQAVGSVFVQLVAGLHHMHTVHATAHRDIKLDNICVSPDGAVKIVDFGCATSSSATAATGACGSEPYMPPEVAASPAVAYDAFKMDIWSLGVVLLALISGHFPWEAPRTSDENFAMYVQHGERLLDHWLGGASGGKLHPAAPLVKRMLALDPAARPSISDVIADSWFRSLIANMRG